MANEIYDPLMGASLTGFYLAFRHSDGLYLKTDNTFGTYSGGSIASFALGVVATDAIGVYRTNMQAGAPAAEYTVQTFVAASGTPAAADVPGNKTSFFSFQWDGANRVDLNNPTVNSIGGGILANPSNKLSTDASGRVNLQATGLDAITATEVTGRASTFPQMLISLYMRFFNRITQTTTVQTMYKSDDITVAVTGGVDDNGTTATVGKKS